MRLIFIFILSIYILNDVPAQLLSDSALSKVVVFDNLEQAFLAPEQVYKLDLRAQNL